MIVILDGCLLLSELKLRSYGIQTYLIKPSEFSGNSEKCKFINNMCKTDDCILISYLDSNNMSIHTSLNPSDETRILASYFGGSAEKLEIKLNRPSDSVSYWRSRSALCRNTRCPAIQVRGRDVTALITDSVCNYLGLCI